MINVSWSNMPVITGGNKTRTFLLQNLHAQLERNWARGGNTLSMGCQPVAAQDAHTRSHTLVTCEGRKTLRSFQKAYSYILPFLGLGVGTGIHASLCFVTNTGSRTHHCVLYESLGWSSLYQWKKKNTHVIINCQDVVRQITYLYLRPFVLSY